MATRRRSAPRRATRPTGTGRRRSSTISAPRGFSVSPDVWRSLIGIAILLVGVITLVAIMLPGQGRLTDWWRNAVAPWLGTGRWVLPPLLIVGGIYVQQAKGVGARWGVALLGAAVAYVCLLGMFELTHVFDFTGGRIGRGLDGFFVGVGTKPGLIPRPAIFALLTAGIVGGLLVAIDRSLPTVLAQLGRGARAVGDTLVPATDPNAVDARPAKAVAVARPVRPTAAAPLPQAGPAVEDPADTRSATRAPSPVPMSQTIWAGGDGPARDSLVPMSGQAVGPLGGVPAGISVGVGAGAAAVARAATHGPDVALAEPARRCPRPHLGASSRGAARGPGDPDRGRPDGPPGELGRHREEAAQLRDRGQGRRREQRPGRHPVRGPSRRPGQDLADRGPRRRPGDGAHGPFDPDRGADPGQGHRRDRDPEREERDRRLPDVPRRHARCSVPRAG